MSNRSAVVIGAGIVGLATAYALAKRNFAVTVLERSHKACGASIRNFGMIWPIGQPPGKLYEYALHSRRTWEHLCKEAGIWCNGSGSLHLAHNQAEWRVLQEVYELYSHERPLRLLSPGEVAIHTPAACANNLLGALYSQQEAIVDPREAIAALPTYLAERYNVVFQWGRCVTYIADQTAYVGLREEYPADLVVVCSGADLETLYPEVFASLPVTKCKLQMMRFEPPAQLNIGPSLCGGLSLVHYNSFKLAPSWSQLQAHFAKEMPSYLDWGIHVMVSQNRKGELTVGDSHEYGLSPDPFDRQFINEMILAYLQKFALVNNWKLLETWNGVYAKMTNGQSHVFLSPEQGVYIINALGGAGMTLSFGLTEEIIRAI